VDEDEQDANPDEDFMNNYGAGAFGGGEGGFGNIDFSKLGAGPGGEPADLPDDDDEEDLADDEEMPDLEEADKGKVPAEPKTAAGGKIEEVE